MPLERMQPKPAAPIGATLIPASRGWAEVHPKYREAFAAARLMPPDGSLICCDVSEEYTAIARKYWEKSGLAPKIDLRLGPALDTLDSLLLGGWAGIMDYAFIDADKENYDAYYEACLKLVRPGGLIAIDNTLWDGKVADENVNDADTLAIRALNAKLHADERVWLSILPFADGLTLALKR